MARAAAAIAEIVRPYWFAAGLVAACGLVAVLVIDDPGRLAVLEYRRDAIAAGDWWRLVTAHVVHLSIAHAVVDVAGLYLVAWIFSAALAPVEQIVVFVAGVLVVDAALWSLHPEVDRYVGISGVLQAWFAAGATRWLSDRRTRTWGLVLLLGLAAKLILERRGFAFWLDGSPFPVVGAAHRWGAAAGVACGVAFAALRRRDGPVDAAAASRVR